MVDGRELETFADEDRHISALDGPVSPPSTRPSGDHGSLVPRDGRVFVRCQLGLLDRHYVQFRCAKPALELLLLGTEPFHVPGHDDQAASR